MSLNTDDELVAALKALRKQYPDWRVGQLVANVAAWARGLKASAVWDMEDREFVAAVNAHLAQRSKEKK